MNKRGGVVPLGWITNNIINIKYKKVEKPEGEGKKWDKVFSAIFLQFCLMLIKH